MWDQSRNALEFFANVPFWRMSNDNSLVTDNNWCLQDGYAFFVVYLPNGGTTSIDLSDVDAGSSFVVQWFDPVVGGNLQNGSVTTVSAGSSVPLGDAPYSPDQDWVVLLTCDTCANTPAPTAGPTGVPVTIAPVATPTPVVVATSTPAAVSQTTPTPPTPSPADSGTDDRSVVIDTSVATTKSSSDGCTTILLSLMILVAVLG